MITQFNDENKIGNFLRIIPNEYYLLFRGIKTVESFPILLNINQNPITKNIFLKPYNELLGCTGIGTYKSADNIYYIMTMW